MYVKIKTWGKLMEEFDSNYNETIIYCRNYFTCDMEVDLPDNRVILIDISGLYPRWWLNGSDYHTISEDMIEYEVMFSYTIYGKKYNEIC